MEFIKLLIIQTQKTQGVSNLEFALGYKNKI